MKINIKNKKIALYVAIILLFVAIVTIIILNTKNKNQYLSEPVPQKALSTSTKSVSIKDLAKWVDNEKNFLWEVKDDIQLEKVKQISEENGLKLIRSDESRVYHWLKNPKQIVYNISANILTVTGSDLLSVTDLTEVNSQTFNELFKKYFGLDFSFEVFKQEQRDTGETVYYAKRYIDEDSMIEIGSYMNQTDYIAVKGGKIVYAKLLLAEFSNTDKIVPLISRAQLDEFVNQTDYPKDFYPKMDALNGDPVFEAIEYIDSEYKKLLNSLNNCQTEDIQVVYLYKNMSQKYLTPVYKLNVLCSAEYKEKKYTIPGIMYLNAISPELISTEK